MVVRAIMIPKGAASRGIRRSRRTPRSPRATRRTTTRSTVALVIIHRLPDNVLEGAYDHRRTGRLLVGSRLCRRSLDRYGKVHRGVGDASRRKQARQLWGHIHVPGPLSVVTVVSSAMPRVVCLRGERETTHYPLAYSASSSRSTRGGRSSGRAHLCPRRRHA